MNKAKPLIVAVTLLAALLLTTCQMEEYVELPVELPVGRIEQDEDGTLSFHLTWVREPGLLPGTDSAENEILPVLQVAYEEFLLYTMMIDPRPFFDKDGDGISPYSLVGGSTNLEGPENRDDRPFRVGHSFNGMFLYNLNPSGDGNIVLHRYRPKLINPATGQLVVPDADLWRSVWKARAAAFKKAAAEMEAMMAALEASPLYIMGSVGEKPLMEFRRAIAEFISYNPPLEQCTQRDEFTWDSVNATRTLVLINPDEVTGGPRVTCGLYEYYLGYVPYPTEYYDPKGPIAF